jgi:hypothetical protein
VLALQDRLAYAPTFEGALASLFGSDSSTLTASETHPAAAATTAGGPTIPAVNVNPLVAQAGRDFADYQKLTAEGKLAEAGQKLDDLKHALGQLGAMPK